MDGVCAASVELMTIPIRNTIPCIPLRLIGR
jgi:hypothetical protein